MLCIEKRFVMLQKKPEHIKNARSHMNVYSNKYNKKEEEEESRLNLKKSIFFSY